MKHAIIVQGLAFGDEGKGTTVDYIVRQTKAKLVVRFNGGAQAAHTVVLPDGRAHTFSQFGSGTLAGARTYLSKFMMWDPLALEVEAHFLDKVMRSHVARVMVDHEAPVLTPWHKGLNRARERARGEARHGSCGVGIGELADDIEQGRTVIRAGDLTHREGLIRMARRVQSEKLMQRLTLPPTKESHEEDERLLLWQPADWAARVRRALGCILLPSSFAGAVEPYMHETVVFEGAQGVLLDQTHGFAPHNTWCDCTFGNADRLLDAINFNGQRTRVGVLRPYFTRHGAGPLPTELTGTPRDAPWAFGEHNTTGDWQGPVRYGYFDAVLARYALRVCGGVNTLALTCMDRLPEGAWAYCDAYHEGRDGTVFLNLPGTPKAEDFARWSALYTYKPNALEGVEKELGVSVGITSAGPTYESKSVLVTVPGGEAWLTGSW